MIEFIKKKLYLEEEYQLKKEKDRKLLNSRIKKITTIFGLSLSIWPIINHNMIIFTLIIILIFLNLFLNIEYKKKLVYKFFLILVNLLGILEFVKWGAAGLEINLSNLIYLYILQIIIYICLSIYVEFYTYTLFKSNKIYKYGSSWTKMIPIIVVIIFFQDNQIINGIIVLLLVPPCLTFFETINLENKLF